MIIRSRCLHILMLAYPETVSNIVKIYVTEAELNADMDNKNDNYRGKIMII